MRLFVFASVAMHVLLRKSGRGHGFAASVPSFPHVFSGNPEGIQTGPPIKTFGGDDLNLSSFHFLYASASLQAMLFNFATSRSLPLLYALREPEKWTCAPIWRRDTHYKFS